MSGNPRIPRLTKPEILRPEYGRDVIRSYNEYLNDIIPELAGAETLEMFNQTVEEIELLRAAPLPMRYIISFHPTPPWLTIAEKLVSLESILGNEFAPILDLAADFLFLQAESMEYFLQRAVRLNRPKGLSEQEATDRLCTMTGINSLTEVAETYRQSAFLFEQCIKLVKLLLATTDKTDRSRVLFAAGDKYVITYVSVISRSLLLQLALMVQEADPATKIVISSAQAVMPEVIGRPEMIQQILAEVDLKPTMEIINFGTHNSFNTVTSAFSFLINVAILAIVMLDFPTARMACRHAHNLCKKSAQIPPIHLRDTEQLLMLLDPKFRA